MYNFALAFVLCAVAYLIGDVVSIKTKAWVPSVFVTAVVLLIGYWTVLPKTLISDSVLIPFGSTIGIYLLITHMGTIISLKQLGEQWKTIVICLAGLAGMSLACWFICIPIIGREYVVAGLPPLTGGIVAAVTMQSAAAERGLEAAAVFAIAMYCVQGFAGYPLTALCLQLEGKKLLKNFRSGAVKAVDMDAIEEANALEAGTANKPAKKKLIPELPEKWNSPIMIFLKLGIVAWFATMLGSIPLPGIGKISGAVWALVLGVLFTTIGLLDVNSLNKANSYGIVMFALMMYVFDGLKDATPEMLGSVIGPMVLLIVVGVAGMAIFVFIAAKLLKTDFCLALANSLTALYGFPPNAIITENTCKALGKDKGEVDYLMSEMYPSMIVGGFTTVTITSVVIAGLFTNLF